MGRPPGISQKSPVFQQALQLAAIAFSPDVRHPPVAATPVLPCHEPTPNRVSKSSRLKPPLTPTATFDGLSQSSSGRGSISCARRQRDPARLVGCKKERSGSPHKSPPQLFSDFTFAGTTGGEGEEEIAGVEPSSDVCCAPVAKSLTPAGPLKKTTSVDGTISMTPASLHASLQPARLFDSGDMMMATRLLGHPESSLKVRWPHARLRNSRSHFQCWSVYFVVIIGGA